MTLGTAKHICRSFQEYGEWRGHTEKAEALAVLHEIAEACAEKCNFSSVSLDNPNAQIVRESAGYEIRMKGDLDFGTLEHIKPILLKHNLMFKQKGDSLTIYRAHK